MKINELITDFSIYLTNEEKSLMEQINGLVPLSSFPEREQVIINNMIRKSVISRLHYNGNVMVMRNEL